MSATRVCQSRVTERRVVDRDVFVLDALGLQIGLEDLVGGARIDIVGAFQHPALHLAAFLRHQVVDGRDRLLVGRGAGVEHVALALLALVLDRIEQDRVQFLEHRQHRLARHRGPAAEHRGDLFLGDQFARLFGEQRPVRRRIDDHRLKLLAEQAALLVLLLDQHQHDVFQRGLADRHGARKRMENADLDRFLRFGGQNGRHRKRKPGRGGEPAAGNRSLCDRTDGVNHCCFLCFTRTPDDPASRAAAEFAKAVPISETGARP